MWLPNRGQEASFSKGKLKERGQNYVKGTAAMYDLRVLFGTANDDVESVKHIYHSGQFRSFLARRQAFWQTFLTEIRQP